MSAAYTAEMHTQHHMRGIRSWKFPSTACHIVDSTIPIIPQQYHYWIFFFCSLVSSEPCCKSVCHEEKANKHNHCVNWLIHMGTSKCLICNVTFWADEKKGMLGKVFSQPVPQWVGGPVLSWFAEKRKALFYRPWVRTVRTTRIKFYHPITCLLSVAIRTINMWVRGFLLVASVGSYLVLERGHYGCKDKSGAYQI